MTTTRPPRRIDPTDPDFHLYQNLKDVMSGVKHRAPGIRRCQDCENPYIDDHSGLPHCPNCRTNHRRFCRQCHALIRNTEQGDRLCASCVNQEALF